MSYCDKPLNSTLRTLHSNFSFASCLMIYPNNKKRHKLFYCSCQIINHSAASSGVSYPCFFFSTHCKWKGIRSMINQSLFFISHINSNSAIILYYFFLPLLAPSVHSHNIYIQSFLMKEMNTSRKKTFHPHIVPKYSLFFL